MTFRKDAFTVEDRACWACLPERGEELPLLIMPGEADMTGMLPQIMEPVERAIEAGDCKPFVLAGFESADWNRDLTPWPAPPLSKKGEAFAGKAGETLAWMLGPFLTAVESRYPVGQSRMDRDLIGYSLGGLFALWAFLTSGAFSGCASCSGSLWYEGWMDFALASHIPPESRIYLSLGRAEEKARNPRMAAVGDVTRDFAAAMKAHPQVAESTLVWQEGGHFQDVPVRLADAMLWLMKTDNTK